MEINPGYAWRQLQEARRRGKAAAIAKWEQVIAGMRDGSLAIGSRTPTKAPAWVTLEVVTGGFATGGYSAGGELVQHEVALRERLRLPASAGRAQLNMHYLESRDAAELLASGCYRIDLPEEGALLAVAWLRAHGHDAAAEELVETIEPWLGELRFYPAPAKRPLELASTVRLQDLGPTLDGIATDRRQRRVEAMRDSLTVWQPLADWAVALAQETCEDGVPFKRFPPGWISRVQQLATAFVKAGPATSRRSARIHELLRHLTLATVAPKEIAPRDVGWVRNVIATHVAAHGQPGTEEARMRRLEQALAVAGPLHRELRAVLVARLRDRPRDAGVRDLDMLARPVDIVESQRSGVPEGSAIPPYLITKLARAWDAPLAALVEQHVIPSSETLARVLPQVTAQVRGQAIGDPALRRLYASLYAAFRRRRGLLLVNYASQVRLEELPWVAVLMRGFESSADATAAARRTAAQASALAVAGFPHTIVPNKLVTELYALGAAAKIELPLVEELAADIFMGAFTRKFVVAARVAARLLRGRLYERYYAIDADEVERLPLPPPKAISVELAELCQRRAGVEGSRGTVAQNGKIIEQCQILTTHNLAVLFAELGVQRPLQTRLRALAEQTFTWILRQLQIGSGGHHAQLIRLKNAAYAWRQLVFYLSFVDDAPDFVVWARQQLVRTRGNFPLRFAPALHGLEVALAGARSDAPAFAAAGGRVFTGWATARHWVLATAG